LFAVPLLAGLPCGLPPGVLCAPSGTGRPDVFGPVCWGTGESGVGSPGPGRAWVLGVVVVGRVWSGVLAPDPGRVCGPGEPVGLGVVVSTWFVVGVRVVPPVGVCVLGVLDSGPPTVAPGRGVLPPGTAEFGTDVSGCT
jgi:hypothetical protein